ncbi:MAG: ABC transporter ATP-binding protein/permease [Candidatus Cloacimonetes bacterium]|nr:ABC transporter ATP-binding protein/permease [Candidatus Cloacimonadota bacterium]
MQKNRSYFLRYVKSTQPYWKYMYIALSMMLAIVWIQTLLPRFFRDIIDIYIPERKFEPLAQSALILAGLYVIRMGAFIWRNNRMLNFGYHYIYDLRNKLMHHFQLLSFIYFDDNKTGDIMNHMLDDVMNTEMMTTNSLIYLLEDLLLIVFIGVILLFMNYKLALISMLILPIYAIVHKYFRRSIGEMNRSIRENYAQLSSEFHDSIAGIRVVRAFNLERERMQQFNKYLEEDRRLRIKTYTFNALFGGLTEYLTIFGILLVLSMGSYYAIRYGTMTTGEIVAFYTYLGFLYNPIIRLSSTTTIIEAGMSSIKRIYKVLDTIPQPPEKLNPLIPKKTASGGFRFENVTFFYEGTKNAALKDVQFNVIPGKTIALVGASGSGKTTIFNLLMRFYDPTAGKILLDDMDIKDLQIYWLRQNISLVLQEGFLFWGTIRENIRYGRIEATDKEVEEAAQMANAEEFIRQLPKGYDTPLGERGVVLSGGQRQRLAIARAILKNAPVLLLDEATSALDNEAEVKIQQAISKLAKNRTTFIIAHRLTTVQNADEIIVLKEGSVIEKGNHGELLALKGEYYRLHTAHEFLNKQTP